MTDPTPNAFASRNVQLSELILDPRLQCRAKIDDDVVNDYAELMRSGVTFPKIEAVEVERQLLVVDGWHRYRAAAMAEVESLEIDVKAGTMRDAMLAAAQANGRHGLRRTNEDKRRAVRLLLQDPEWAAMSDGKLAKLANVSRPHIGNMRRLYGVKKGEVLTEERIEEVDGDLPARYRELLEGRSSYYEDDVRKMRRAKRLSDLRPATEQPDTNPTAQAAKLRLDDLAVYGWPWTDDTTKKARIERARTVDTRKEIEAVITSEDCPIDRFELLKVWVAAARVGKADQAWEIERLQKKMEGRPAFLATLGEASQTAAPKYSAVQDAATAIEETEDASQRHAAILAAEPATLTHLVHRMVPKNWSPFTPKQTALYAADRPTVRKALENAGVEIVDCPDPSCGGWTIDNGACLVCAWRPSERGTHLSRALVDGPMLIAHGHPVRVGGVLVNTIGVELLQRLAEEQPELPQHLRSLLTRYMAADEQLAEQEAAEAAEQARAEAERAAVLAKSNPGSDELEAEQALDDETVCNHEIDGDYWPCHLTAGHDGDHDHIAFDKDEQERARPEVDELIASQKAAQELADAARAEEDGEPEQGGAGGEQDNTDDDTAPELVDGEIEAGDEPEAIVDQMVSEAVKQLSEAVSLREVARNLGVSRTTLRRRLIAAGCWDGGQLRVV